MRWQVLPRLRQRAETGALLTSGLNRARGDLRIVLALLAALHGQGLSLTAATQASVDSAWQRGWTCPRRHRG